ncbi:MULTISPECIES: hemolysin family protein [unclassified Spirosoma]|uniref:hemolysin family protein n=1 Tax=unclassified Spirosoma TaxID=2621999 RepID=UPI0009636F74|nr:MULTISPECIES: hemolysin family protein [unclassified Spirosoma]MBN8825234.1 HlyC/CorC family transporter [Spirosoma sp.]OJW75278.1 MAG: hemolysin [Spirosoma sp. 48-14]
MESYALLFGALLALVLAGFFSAVEMAYVSVNRLYFELHSKQGPLSEKLVSGFLKNPILFIGTTLTGNTLFLVLYTVLGVMALNPLLALILPPAWAAHEFVIITIETLILTIIFLPFADYIPKSLALIHPDRFLEGLAVPLWVIYKAIAPIVRVLVGTARFFIRYILGKRNPEIRPVFGLTDLNQYLQQLNQKADAEKEVEVDTEIFNNAIEFRDVRVRDCLVPRTEIAAVAVDDSVEELRQAFQDSGHSKIVVYRNTIDDVIGYCHALALFKKPATIEEIITPIITVPQTMPAQDLFLRFLSERKSLALVVDEFGGTAGIVSVEDMVEQIFGEIQDEYDTNEDWVEQQLDERTWLLSARHEIDSLNETYGWNIPEGSYDTLGGLILATHEDVPQVGEVIEFSPFTFTIVSMDGTRIDTVKVHLNREK